MYFILVHFWGKLFSPNFEWEIFTQLQNLLNHHWRPPPPSLSIIATNVHCRPPPRLRRPPRPFTTGCWPSATTDHHSHLHLPQPTTTSHRRLFLSSPLTAAASHHLPQPPLLAITDYSFCHRLQVSSAYCRTPPLLPTSSSYNAGRRPWLTTVCTIFITLYIDFSLLQTK